MRYIKYSLLILPVIFLLSPRRDTSGLLTFPVVPDENLNNVKIIEPVKGQPSYTVKDLTYEKDSIPFISDIVLSFNVPPSRLARDDTKKYRISSSNYDFIAGQGSLGSGCARFFKGDHAVEIETSRDLWLGSCEDLGSFTIEMRFYLHTVRDGGILFSRIGLFSGKKRGIEILVKNGKISSRFHGIFDMPDGRDYDVSLDRGRPLAKDTWYHLSISFDRISGKLAKHVNGKEEEVVYITESREPYNGVYIPTFGYRKRDGQLSCVDSPPAVIGRNFSGLIDEFRISYRHFEDLEERTELAYRNYSKVGAIGRIPFNVEGVVTSPVYHFSGTGTKVLEFKWKEKLLRNTFIWVQFRISDHNFKEDDDSVKWYRIKNNQRKIYLMKNEKGEYLRGKYYQWRAHLIPSPEGKYSPLLSDIQLHYRLDVDPNPPQFLEVVSVDDNTVRLKWKKNVDADILGYKIYYGTTPGKYDGIISEIGGKKITNSISQENYISVTITNDTIEENRSLHNHGLLPFPLLKNTVLYFFAVAAYDSYKPDTRYNHESEPSKPVTARPFSGTEIE